MASQSVWYTLSAIFIAVVGLMGLGTMFVRASNIDRNALVGTLTVVTALIAGAVLYFSRNLPSMGAFPMAMVALFSLTGFFLGRGIDRMLGATGPSDDARNATLGSDLSD
jgi:hypothetical protein